MKQKILMITLGSILAVVSFLYTHGVSADWEDALPAADVGVRVGQALPEFSLPSLDGQEVAVRPSGKITVINFWTTWCPPCQEEMPELDAFAQGNQEKVNFYAVNLQESQEKVKTFMDGNGYTMPVLLDEEGDMGKKFQIRTIPTTLIVNKHGVIKFRKSGPMTRGELEGIINSM